MAEAKKSGSGGGYKVGIDFNLNPCAPVFLLLILTPLSIATWLIFNQ